MGELNLDLCLLNPHLAIHSNSNRNDFWISSLEKTKESICNKYLGLVIETDSLVPDGNEKQERI